MHDLVSEDVMHSTHNLHMEAGFKRRHREGGYIWFLAMPSLGSTKNLFQNKSLSSLGEIGFM